MAPNRRTTKAKTHVLKNTDLRTIIEPADPDEVAFTATKGETISMSVLESLSVQIETTSENSFLRDEVFTFLSQDDNHPRPGSAISIFSAEH